MQESIAELEKEKSEVDTERIKALYEEAKVLMPNMQKTFEETLSFHNQMLNEKKKFIQKELPDIDQQLEESNRRLAELTLNEQALSKKLHKMDAIQSLEEVIEGLNREYESKGRYEERKKQLEDSQKRIDSYESELKKIDETIDSQARLIGKRVAKFNEDFAKISRELYGEEFILSPYRGERGYTLNISKIGGNLGTGKKKGETLAFDLAYIQFADAMKIKCLHFVLHDQIEIVHGHQISTLLTNIVERANGQLVLPVLIDKLPLDIDAKQYKILGLSQQSKLFGV